MLWQAPVLAWGHRVSLWPTNRVGPKPKAAARSGAARTAVGLRPTITFLLGNEPASGRSVAGGCSILSTFLVFWLCIAAVMLRGGAQECNGIRRSMQE